MIKTINYLLLSIFLVFSPVLNQNLSNQSSKLQKQNVKQWILQFNAMAGVGIVFDQKNNQFIYNQAISFKQSAKIFQNYVMNGYRAGLSQIYNIVIDSSNTQKLKQTLTNTFKDQNLKPLIQFILKGQQLRAYVNSQKFNPKPNQQKNQALKIISPLIKLYDQTYGKYFQQSNRYKLFLVVGNGFYGDGMKNWFDSRRNVFGMKKVNDLPQTFKFFHSKARKITSQLDQDGVIQAIFQVIKPKYNCTKYFVQVGGGSDIDNTALLRSQKGWTGKLFNAGIYYMGRSSYPVTSEMVTPQASLQIFKKHKVPTNLDFLSIDVDSRDCWILNQLLKQFKPAVTSIQFNPNYGPEVSASQYHNSTQYWCQGKGQGRYCDKYYGCSARAAYDISQKYGYGLVYYQSLTDIFFVKKQLLPVNLKPLKLQDVFDPFPIHSLDVQFRIFEQYKNDKSINIQTQNYFDLIKNQTELNKAIKKQNMNKEQQNKKIFQNNKTHVEQNTTNVKQHEPNQKQNKTINNNKITNSQNKKQLLPLVYTFNYFDLIQNYAKIIQNEPVKQLQINPKVQIKQQKSQNNQPQSINKQSINEIQKDRKQQQNRQQISKLQIFGLVFIIFVLCFVTKLLYLLCNKHKQQKQQQSYEISQNSQIQIQKIQVSDHEMKVIQ